MNDHSPPFAPIEADEPDRSLLPPAVAALLDFEPAPRQVQRPDGWTPARQRRFIALLAMSGSPRAAADAIGKNLSGLKHLYRAEGAEGLRTAWKAAMEYAAGQMRQARAGRPSVPADVPGIATRQPAPRPGGHDQAPDGEEPEDAERRTEALVNIGVKFLRKVAAEREARLSGRIVTADFYLRQVTMLEVMIDLMSDGLGCPYEMLAELKRGGHGLLQIADTPFSRRLDEKRRAFWESHGEPMRPEAFAEEFLCDHGDHRTQAEQHVYGAMTEPARGYTQEQWAAMSTDEQREARQRQFDQDAAEQIAYEQSAYAAWHQRQFDEDRHAQAVRGTAEHDGDALCPREVRARKAGAAFRAQH